MPDCSAPEEAPCHARTLTLECRPAFFPPDREKLPFANIRMVFDNAEENSRPCCTVMPAGCFAPVIQSPC